jgi:hypothetical protein
LRAEDVQRLSDADAIAAFFGRLGYNTNPRTFQTPGNLGITNETALRRIRRIELIADNEGFLQVYLFQLASLTIADARALAVAFRNRAGNFLLVLTVDFERIDFVLVEKYTPAEHEGSIAKPQVKVRNRTLSVERRKPERLHLRVLGRFTWTEVDAFAQYEKLLAAYSLAYWSEEYFNNRALFSDYFLKERLTDSDDFPEWKEDPKPAYTQMRQKYEAAKLTSVPLEGGGPGEGVTQTERAAQDPTARTHICPVRLRIGARPKNRLPRGTRLSSSLSESQSGRPAARAVRRLPVGSIPRRQRRDPRR